MTDTRSRREKLEAMARSGSSNFWESQNAIAKIIQMDSKTDCPGCGHGEFFHVASMCYRCGDLMITGKTVTAYCGWSILGKGNAWDLPPGWHHWEANRESRDRGQPQATGGQGPVHVDQVPRGAAG
jgi:hypothetical protein